MGYNACFRTNFSNSLSIIFQNIKSLFRFSQTTDDMRKEEPDAG